MIKYGANDIETLSFRDAVRERISALNHSGYYQHTKVEEKEKVIYTYYE